MTAVGPLKAENKILKDELNDIKQQLGAIRCMLVGIQTVTFDHLKSIVLKSEQKLEKDTSKH